MVPSATPPQFDSVGPWQTRMPISVAASTSTSSTPIVYLATIRSSGELSMILRLIGTFPMHVPNRIAQWLVSALRHADQLGLAVALRSVPGRLAQAQLAPFRLESPVAIASFLDRGEDEDRRATHDTLLSGLPLPGGVGQNPGGSAPGHEGLTA